MWSQDSRYWEWRQLTEETIIRENRTLETQ